VAGDLSNRAPFADRRYPRPVLRVEHFARLVGDLVAYAVVNRAWWVIPMTLLLALATLLVVVGQAAAPVTLYPMF
jgi:hypothetical protein